MFNTQGQDPLIIRSRRDSASARRLTDEQLGMADGRADGAAPVLLFQEPIPTAGRWLAVVDLDNIKHSQRVVVVLCAK